MEGEPDGGWALGRGGGGRLSDSGEADHFENFVASGDGAFLEGAREADSRSSRRVVPEAARPVHAGGPVRGDVTGRRT